MKRFPTDLFLIIDPSVLPDKDPVSLAEDALAGGVRMIQFRDKKGTREKVYHTACAILERTRTARAILIINDDLDLALACKAEGIHLGQDDFPLQEARKILGSERIIGISAHTPVQARTAADHGADYLGVGPIFPSPTKKARPALGCEILKEIKRDSKIPIFAIGGLGLENSPSALKAGADGIACISAILNQPDITKASQQMLEVIHSVKEQVRMSR